VNRYIIPMEELTIRDVPETGGKNASLGEMIRELKDLGVAVPGGFATTATAYRDFVAQNGLADKINAVLSDLDVDDVEKLAKTGAAIRGWITDTPLQPRLAEELTTAFEAMSDGQDIAVAVRSSATAEDLPEASFAGQQETFLNVRGIDDVVARVHEVFASLFNDRAIAYRVHQGFDHSEVALSAGIQHMVRSDIGASGVMFTLDTDTGFPDVVFITSAWGLGETVVQGAVNPDEYYVFKPSLEAGNQAIVRRTLGTKAIKMTYGDDGAGTVTVDVPDEDRERHSLSDEDVHELARQAVTIEKHYGRPMDIEWGKDGNTGELFILQARPETVQSRRGSAMQRFQLKNQSKVLITGRAIGHKIGAGETRVIDSPSEMHRVRPGDVLVADMTDPDWEPIMKRAAAIVTNRGGRTCHAAIIARELGIPAVVGCGDATEILADGVPVTVSCARATRAGSTTACSNSRNRSSSSTSCPKCPSRS
jgi:pyruvate,water dikinase